MSKNAVEMLTKIANAIRRIFRPPHLRMTPEDQRRQVQECAVVSLAKLGCAPATVHDVAYAVGKDDFWDKFFDAYEAIAKQYAEVAERASQYVRGSSVSEVPQHEALAIRMLLTN